ncbi:hypothetical protein QD357_11615 [Rhizobium sp. BR 317]|uniref:hypothetical protein n=1 Tax=Rhizobium sp. BR 317 TaxID=3040015 RepID=UPI0039BED442
MTRKDGSLVPKGNYVNLSEESLDRNVYRIMPEAWVLSMFSNKANTLTQVHKWKDKFENFLLNAGGVLDGEPFAYSFKEDFVGQCWTSKSLSEAMWGIYANDPTKRFLRIRSTPRKLLASLVAAHPEMPQYTCFIGKVKYETESGLRDFLNNNGLLQISSDVFARSLLLKRRAFKHESEIRLLFFGDAKHYSSGLYSYTFDPHIVITQIMADPNRDRKNWQTDKQNIRKATGFSGEVKRSKIYDSPEWDPPAYHSVDVLGS